MSDTPSLAAPRTQRFREEREPGWRALEGLLARLERGSLDRLTADELIAIPGLYRATLSALSVARATSLDHSLVEYLEDLSTRAYFLVYGTRTSLRQRLVSFFATEWPAAARAVWPETLLSWGSLLAGMVLAWVLVWLDADWFNIFVPEGLASGRDPAASTASLKAALYDGGEDGAFGLFSAYLFTHNAQVAIFAFALGFALCLPTALLLAYSGGTVGAFGALYAGRGLGLSLGGWLGVHGVTEMTAVVLAGAAGFRIGRAVIAPGRLSRLDALTAAGQTAGTLMAGVFVMLVCAGLLEGVVRQVVTGDGERYAIAALTAVLWGSYLYLPRR